MIEIEPYAGEPDINRLVAAFRHEEVDRVPNYEVVIEDRHVTRLLGRPAGPAFSGGAQTRRMKFRGRQPD